MYGGCHYQANCVFIVIVILQLILSMHNTINFLLKRQLNNGRSCLYSFYFSNLKASRSLIK
ncbi:hypothetical protein L873DRAFT_1909785, partial [Choiromyces venosus 120613-1]